MDRATDFFRTCPSCGRRFHVRLVESRLVGERRDVEIMKQGRAASTSTKNVYVVLVEEDIPVTIEVKDFQYTYKCKRCGHAWSETREKANKA